METFSKGIQFVLPVFIVLILSEMIISKIRNKQVFNIMDSVSSLSSGITNVLKRVLGLTIYIFTYDFLVEHLAVFHFKSSALQYVIGFFAIDFYVYWNHRWRHRYNLLWNDHVIHHSSEEYNLPVALRQTIGDFADIYFFLIIPAAIFGIPSNVMSVLAVVMLFGGFWYHTQLIGKLGFLEKIIVTPSHHRIHHAINPIYLDRNFGGILIIWDKLFGTFQEELPEEKPIYGITRQVSTWNPIKINFIHILLLIKDAWRTNNIKDKFRIWFMPTGWRPSDVIEKYPVSYITDVYHQEKYMPASSNYLKAWSLTQLTVTFLIMMFLIVQLVEISKPGIFVYGFFIFYSVYCYTSLMDRDKYAWILELVRCIIAFSIINYYGDWFTLNKFLPLGTTILSVYFIISTFVSIAFEYFEFKNNILPTSASIRH
ncbi:MAG: sterol desaturase family protein [Chitinophagales bacterium]|nr:sterol desaturase family protein [Chitinophagales bacterium]